MWWLAIVTFAVVYNFWMIILRVAFPVDTSTLLPLWLVLDYVFDSSVLLLHCAYFL